MTPTTPQRLAGWAVHAYTSLGLPLALYGAYALIEGDVASFFVANCIAVFVDATDGAMARAVDIKRVVPEFSGRRLDDLTDFLTFSFLPALALVHLNLLPAGFAWVAALPLLASGYGFCQERAKTDDAFVGFPSYWNIVLLYLYVLEASPWVVLATCVGLSILVFIPIHYVYPSRTAMLRPVTIGLGTIWALMLTAASAAIDAPWAKPLMWASWFYPVYYTVISAIHHQRVHRAARSAP